MSPATNFTWRLKVNLLDTKDDALIFFFHSSLSHRRVWGWLFDIQNDHDKVSVWESEWNMKFNLSECQFV